MKKPPYVHEHGLPPEPEALTIRSTRQYVAGCYARHHADRVTYEHLKWIEWDNRVLRSEIAVKEAFASAVTGRIVLYRALRPVVITTMCLVATGWWLSPFGREFKAGFEDGERKAVLFPVASPLPSGLVQTPNHTVVKSAGVKSAPSARGANLP